MRLFIAIFLCILVLLSADLPGQQLSSHSQTSSLLPTKYRTLKKERIQLSIAPDFRGFRGDRDNPDVFTVSGVYFNPDSPHISLDLVSQQNLTADNPLRKNPLVAAVYQISLVQNGRFRDARSFVRSRFHTASNSTITGDSMESAFWSDDTLLKAQRVFQGAYGVRPLLIWDFPESTVVFLLIYFADRPPIFDASRLSKINGFYFIHPPGINFMSSNQQYSNLYNAYLSESMNLGNFVSIAVKNE